MPGLGVIVNVSAVLIGTAIGLLFGRLIAERFRLIAFAAIGLTVIVIGANMSIAGLTALSEGELGAYAALALVGSLVVGALVGEGLRIEYWLERFGEVLQEAAYKAPLLAPGRADQPGEKAHTLVEGFVTASLLFGVGAMTVLGSIQDGLGDPSLLYLKALLDGISAIALATTLGGGVGFSVIPMIVLQGGIAAGAHSIEVFVTPEVIASIQMVGGAIILAIGFDLAGIRRLPVGNMLPAIFIAALVAGVLT
ncbi:MAG: DUF554 domain-containing protein [Coriobacteriia bacterium]|jgi:uncharacterized membrane protein YqgA involved in biofilm formation|nr:DUF554 domain-containing protein [Coriobacteriia bacterium]